MDWPRGPYCWIENRILYISVPFTWNLPGVRVGILQSDFRYDRVVVGGPAVRLMPDYLVDVAVIGGEMPGVLQRVNPQATRSTTGCVNNCGFCGVNVIEPGGFKELEDWPDLPVYCDNNLLAARRKHFDKVVDRLKKHPFADFNQGLDASLLKPYHARRLAELHKPILRIAWDNIPQQKSVMRAISYLQKAGIPKSRIRCCVLIGYSDTPSAARYRLERLRDLGIKTNPMRYQPLDALERNASINTPLSADWTEDLLTDYMKYWSNFRFFSGIPFEEFNRFRRRKGFGIKGQKALLQEEPCQDSEKRALPSTGSQ